MRCLNAQDTKGNTLLMLASVFGSVCLVKYLLELGVDVTLKNRLGETALTLSKSAEIKDAIIERSYKDKTDEEIFIAKYKCTPLQLDIHKQILGMLRPSRINHQNVCGDDLDKCLDVVVGSNNYWYMREELSKLHTDKCPYTRKPFDTIHIVYEYSGKTIQPAQPIDSPAQPIDSDSEQNVSAIELEHRRLDELFWISRPISHLISR